MKKYFISHPLLLLLSLIALPALATVHLPTGEYRASAVDLRVKVQGGEVVIQPA